LTQLLPIAIIYVTCSAGSTSNLGELKFQGGGDLYRKFLTPPGGAQWCDLVVTDLRKLTDASNYCETDDTSATTAVPAADPTSSSSDGNTAGGTDSVSSGSGSSGSRKQDAKRMLMVLHALQLLPHTPYRDAEKQVYLQLLPGQAEVTAMFDTFSIYYLFHAILQCV
jgi:hypothetical protein